MSLYDVHQKLRTKAVRLVKKQQLDEAIEELFAGAKKLLEAKDQGSGCDLGIYMISIYEQAQKPCDDETRNRVTTLLALAQPDFWRKKLLDAALKWSNKVTDSSGGDTRLRLFAAELLAGEHAYYTAEGHYLAVCSNTTAPAACASFATSTANWLSSYAQEVARNDSSSDKDQLERILAGDFALRVVLPLLSVGSSLSSALFLKEFLALVTARQPSILLPVTPNPRPYQAPGIVPGSAQQAMTAQLYVTASPNLNFVQMVSALVAAAQSHLEKTRGAPVPGQLRDSWKALVTQWHREATEDQGAICMNDIDAVSSKFFQLSAPQKRGTSLQDMMASMLGGPPSGQSGSPAKRPASQHPAPPVPSISNFMLNGQNGQKADSSVHQADTEEDDLD